MYPSYFADSIYSACQQKGDVQREMKRDRPCEEREIDEKKERDLREARPTL